MLQSHRELAFVGATHDQLPGIFRQVIEKSPNQHWERILFLFLDDAGLQSAHFRSRSRRGDTLVQAKAAAREELRALLLNRVREQVEFREFSEPYLFASYLDWKTIGGIIHISPHVWGADVSDCPALDYQWLTQEPTRAYKIYRDAIARYRDWSREWP